LAEVKRYGGIAGYSKPGEFVYDHPFQWGSRRIGPDLAREGGAKTDDWHFSHFLNPTSVVPGSIMPPYEFLAMKKVDFGSIPIRVGAMRLLGVPYTLKDKQTSQQNAETQALEIATRIANRIAPAGEQDKLRDELKDKEIVAIIAYLQRLGTDVVRPDGNWNPPGVGQSDSTEPTMNSEGAR
jgi:cytochrome c oxidase cbb3-type subunit I/II